MILGFWTPSPLVLPPLQAALQHSTRRSCFRAAGSPAGRTCSAVRSLWACSTASSPCSSRLLAASRLLVLPSSCSRAALLLPLRLALVEAGSEVGLTTTSSPPLAGNPLAPCCSDCCPRTLLLQRHRRLCTAAPRCRTGAAQGQGHVSSRGRAGACRSPTIIKRAQHFQ